MKCINKKEGGKPLTWLLKNCICTDPGFFRGVSLVDPEYFIFSRESNICKEIYIYNHIKIGITNLGVGVGGWGSGLLLSTPGIY